MKTMATSDHHWYASTLYDWACAESKEAVIKKLARVSGSMIGNDGIDALVCKVHLPITVHYQIREYLPHNVAREPATKVMILNTRGKFTE